MSGSCSTPPLPWKNNASRPVLAIINARVVSPSANDVSRVWGELRSGPVIAQPVGRRQLSIKSRPSNAVNKQTSVFLTTNLATDGGSLSVLLHQLRNERGPAGLMTGADAGAVVAVEVFVEGDQVAPMRIFLEFFCAAEDRPAALFVA